MLIASMKCIYVLEQPRSSFMLDYHRLREALLLMKKRLGMKEPGFQFGMLFSSKLHSIQLFLLEQTS